MSTTDTETTAERLGRVEAELARVRQRADARDHLGPMDTPPSASALWQHERAEELRTAQLKAAERQREQAERQARIDAPKREKRDQALVALDTAIAGIHSERARLSSEVARLTAERTKVAGSLLVPAPTPARPYGQPRDLAGRAL